jgi:hypothetical protein
MAFSFFTKSSNRISRRLRLIGNAFQMWGITTATWVPLSFWMLTKMEDRLPPEQRGLLGPKMLIGGLGLALSQYLVGRAFKRRQRWGAYLAVLTLAAPWIFRLLYGFQLNVITANAVLNLVGLVLIASVWKELHPSGFEVELDDSDDDEPDEPFTPRNRGYGEPRPNEKSSLPPHDPRIGPVGDRRERERQKNTQPQ